MELKQIKELIAAMGRSDLSELAIEEGNFKLQLKRQANILPVASMQGQFSVEEQSPKPLPVTYTAHPLVPTPTPATSDQSGRFITAPMVGTCYLSASPEDPLFVKRGDRVEPETVVCIIEAMKVMNEIKAGQSGTIDAILIDNAHPVEFGTKLFRLV